MWTPENALLKHGLACRAVPALGAWRLGRCRSPRPAPGTGRRIAPRSTLRTRTRRAPETQPAALVLGKEALGTDLVGVFGDQPTFAADPRRPDRLDRLVSIGNADKGGGRVVDDDQGLERDEWCNCTQLLQVVDDTRQRVVEVHIEGVEVEQIEEFEPRGRMVGQEKSESIGKL